MAAQCRGGDLLEWVGPDISACVFRRLDHPADLVRAAAVSQTWRRFVIENNLSKSLCVRLCPEVATVAAVAEVTRSPPSPAVPESDSERDFRIYSNLAGAVVSTPRNPDVACITHCIGASSTDEFPDETMENTLDEDYIVNFRPSYWSSGGADEPESLTYRLNHDICIVDEIRVKPFEAYFQHGDPIYSSTAVRFRMGHYKLPRRSESFVTANDENKMVNADTKYMWTCTSPEYPMLQGTLSPLFMVNISNPEGYSILKYLPGAQNLYAKDMKQDDTKESLEWQSLIARYNQMNQIAVVNALLGPRFMDPYDVDGVSDDDPFE